MKIDWDSLEVELNDITNNVLRVCWSANIGCGTIDIFQKDGQWMIDNETLPREIVKGIFSKLLDALPLLDE